MHCLGARGGEWTGQRGEAPPQGWGAASAIPQGQGMLSGALVSAPNELWQGHSMGSSAMLAGFQSFSFPSQFFSIITPHEHKGVNLAPACIFHVTLKGTS